MPLPGVNHPNSRPRSHTDVPAPAKGTDAVRDRAESAITAIELPETTTTDGSHLTDDEFYALDAALVDWQSMDVPTADTRVVAYTEFMASLNEGTAVMKDGQILMTLYNDQDVLPDLPDDLKEKIAFIYKAPPFDRQWMWPRDESRMTPPIMHRDSSGDLKVPEQEAPRLVTPPEPEPPRVSSTSSASISPRPSAERSSEERSSLSRLRAWGSNLLTPRNSGSVSAQPVKVLTTEEQMAKERFDGSIVVLKSRGEMETSSKFVSARRAAAMTMIDEVAAKAGKAGFRDYLKETLDIISRVTNRDDHLQCLRKLAVVLLQKSPFPGETQIFAAMMRAMQPPHEYPDKVLYSALRHVLDTKSCVT